MKSAMKRLERIEHDLGARTGEPVGPPIDLTEEEERVLDTLQARMDNAAGEPLPPTDDELHVLAGITARMEEARDALSRGGPLT